MAEGDGGCVIVGAGPAGLLLGLLLARRGVRVTVLEQQPDFERSFRGNTLSPGTLHLLEREGLITDVLALPHTRAGHFTAVDGRGEVRFADFGSLSDAYPFVLLLQQSDFLPVLANAALQEPGFRLRMGTRVRGLIRDHDAVTGVEIETDGRAEILPASLVIGADGRRSVVRREAGLEALSIGAPIDVLWFTLPRSARDDREQGAYFRFGPGMMLALMDAGTHWQVGAIIRKGSLAEIRARGIEHFRESVATAAPAMADRLEGITDLDELALLEVQVDRLRRWYGPGVLCIGDAAHAMSPVGMIGINLAIRDAALAAEMLAPHLRTGLVPESVLRRFQKKREPAIRLIQAIQSAAHRIAVTPALDGRSALPEPVRTLMGSRPAVSVATRLIAR